MQALLLSEYRKLQVIDAPMRVPATDEVLPRVKGSGICGLTPDFSEDHA
jgi:hypothetical protein